jgi:UDP-2-acetamido-3-amino-2,3-dideoxy-glucuronate N-acetyltransferase
MIDPTAQIHADAHLEPEVRIGGGTRVGPRTHLGTGARVGADCELGRDVFIDAGVTIGDRVRVDQGVLVYHGATIEDGVYIGPGAIVTNDRHPRAITPEGEVLAPGDMVLREVTLRYGCSLGAGAVVVAGTTVGRFATVGAGGVVTRNVPDHGLVAGSPARRIGWVCACGARLLNDNEEPAPAAPDRYSRHPELHCARCGRRYRHLHEEDALVALAPTRPGGASAT